MTLFSGGSFIYSCKFTTNVILLLKSKQYEGVKSAMITLSPIPSPPALVSLLVAVTLKGEKVSFDSQSMVSGRLSPWSVGPETSWWKSAAEQSCLLSVGMKQSRGRVPERKG